MTKILSSIKGDKVIWTVVLLLSLFSILAVYSSTGTLAYRFKQGNTEYYILKHCSILLFGIFLMYLSHRVKYTYYANLSYLAIFVAVPLLLYTLVFGTSTNEASRWYTLPGFNVTFQPSDFAKLALIMFLARQLAKHQENRRDFMKAFVPVIVPIIVITGLIMPANLSTALLLFLTSVVLMFIGRVHFRYIMLTVAAGFIGLALFISVIYLFPKTSSRVATWKHRIENFLSKDSNPDKIDDKDYQVKQALIAVANGGVFGKLPGNSTQKNFLPHPYSDFIYAIIIEEYGLIGGIIVVFLYLILLYRGMRIAAKAPRAYGAFLAIGITCSLVFQAMINMAVAVKLAPVTGQTLPLISMGGSSIWFTSVGIGIILSVSRDQEENSEEPEGIKETVNEA